MKKAVSAMLAVVLAAAVMVLAAGCGSTKSKKAPVIPKATTSPTSPTQTPTYGNKYAKNGAAAQTTTNAKTMKDDPEAVKKKALAFYSTSEADGSFVTINEKVKASDGTQFYSVYVNTADGSSYLLYVAIDGSVAYDEETYAEKYKSSKSSNDDSDDYEEEATEADYGAEAATEAVYDYGYEVATEAAVYDYGAGGDAYGDYNVVEPYNEGAVY